MFTGIIAAVGNLHKITPKEGDVLLHLNTGKLDLSDVNLGDSIAVNGTCLTVIELYAHGFSADVSVETLSRTTLKNLKVGSRVNLEKALTPTTRLGGHLVSGHVDGLGKVLSNVVDARSIRLVIEVPKHLEKYFAEKGSVCVDGVSLTVNEVNGTQFTLNIVPHTANETNVADWVVGAEVNIEVDVIARYLERLLLGNKTAHDDQHGMTKAFLHEHGFDL